jgi:hypothetical protein
MTMSYQKRVKSLLDRVGEYRADYQDILDQLEQLRQQCVAGMSSEKVHMKMDDGFVSVVEVFPQVALGAIMGKLAVLKELTRIASLEETDTQISLTFNLEPLEGDLADESAKLPG